MYYLYTDEYKEEVKYTLKAVNEKITIISMKRINVKDFTEEVIEISDIPTYI